MVVLRESREARLDHHNSTHELGEVSSNHDGDEESRRSFRARLRSRGKTDVV